MNKNNFPFIIAVKGRGKNEIMAVFKQRLKNDSESEFKTALKQVVQIAGFRIDELAGN